VWPLKVRPTPTLRTAVFLAGDVVIWSLALYGAFLLRFDGSIPPNHWNHLPLLLLIFLPTKIFWHYLFRLYRVTWRLIGLTDLLNVWKANTLGSLTILMLLVFATQRVLGFTVTTRSVLILDYALSVGGILLFRFARRLWDFQWGGLGLSRRGPGHRVLLVGAGAAGERLARSMLDNPQGIHRPVGFIDDETAKWGTYLHGLRIFGGRSSIPDVVRGQRVDEIVIAIPSATPEQLRGIVEFARQSDVHQVRILPGVHELLSGKARLQDVREVQPDDLLGRPPVKIDMETISRFVKGKRVLVTGAAGSIGSELVRQLSRFPCEEILALDINESGLFELEEALAGFQVDVSVRTIIADVRDRDKVDWVLSKTRPQVVFHAAAYKHVPLMERYAEEAVKTNILGTFVLMEAAVRTSVETFVLISTDKAVNPNNVMGATKRVAEKIGQALSHRGRTRFLTVRFGNVLGSRGSLIPVLQEQIRRGGPITLTHPDMRRFVMSISEAVLLVLQVATMDRRTSIFVLDMGEPVRIVDLAMELIRLSGLEPDKDIPFLFTGVRPGEKMEEELVESGEALLPTPFEKVREIEVAALPQEMAVRLALQELERLAHQMDAEGTRALLNHIAANDWMTVQGAAVGHPR
jgi:FlaA1/EpsC-like NDP-sugar epimerase